MIHTKLPHDKDSQTWSLAKGSTFIHFSWNGIEKVTWKLSSNFFKQWNDSYKKEWWIVIFWLPTAESKGREENCSYNFWGYMENHVMQCTWIHWSCFHCHEMPTEAMYSILFMIERMYPYSLWPLHVKLCTQAYSSWPKVIGKVRRWIF